MKRSMILAAMAGLGAALAGASMAPAAVKDAYWNVQDGHWNDLNNWTPRGPTGYQAHFNNVDAGESVVTLDKSYENYADASVYRLNVGAGKIVRLDMGDGTKLTATDDFTNGGGGSITFAGPNSGSATISLPRMYGGGGTADTVVFTGNLGISFDGAKTSSIYYGTVLEITDGASLNATTDTAGNLIIQYGSGSRITVADHGSFSGSYIRVAQGSEGDGLLQLGKTGHLSASDASSTGTLAIEVRSNGRFEAEGDGMASTVAPTIKSGGTLAVGVTPIGGSHSTSAALTLQSATTIEDGGILEMGLFGNGDNDQIILSSAGAMNNGSGSGTILRLVTPTGYTPQAHDSWTLFTEDGDTGSISGNFDLSQLGDEYDVRQFNSAGGWKISVVPEPASFGLLLMGGLGALTVRRRRA